MEHPVNVAWGKNCREESDKVFAIGYHWCGVAGFPLALSKINREEGLVNSREGRRVKVT